MSQDIREYIKQQSKALKEKQDNVRNAIGKKHWGEDGRYKELILREWLKKELAPLGVGIGTGFVIDGDKPSSQIDIIIYNPQKAHFRLPEDDMIDDLIIIDKNSVLAILEVKTRIEPRTAKTMINKLINNKKLIGKHIFAGIFAYECQAKDKELNDESLKKVLVNSKGNLKKGIEQSLQMQNEFHIDCIAFGENYFMKFWEANLPDECYKHKHYSFYNLEDLSFGYFMLNIVEHILLLLHKDRKFTQEQLNSIYPEGDKEGGKLLDYNELGEWKDKPNSIFKNFADENNKRGNRR